MTKLKLTLAAALLAAAVSANAASLTVDLPISFEIVPSCKWTSTVNDASLLTASDMSKPIEAQFNIAAICTEGTAYAITADAPSKNVNKAGEFVTIALFGDAGRTAPLSTTAVTGVGGQVRGVTEWDNNILHPLYLKVTGEGANGGFLGGGVIPLTSFTLTITY